MTGTVQQIVGGGQGAIGAGTYYTTPFGGHWTLTDNNLSGAIVPHSLTLQKFKVTLDTAPGAGKTRTFAIRRNNVTTGITLTISDAETSGEDVANTQACVAGDKIEIIQTDTGTPAGCTPRWTLEADPNTQDEYWIAGAFQPSPTVAKVGSLYTSEGGGGSTIEEQYLSPCPVAGTMKNLYVELNNDPGTAPDTYTFTFRKGFANTGLTCSIVADNKTGNDTVNTVAVSAGDLLCMGVAPANSPAVTPWAWFGMTLLLDGANTGQSPVLGSVQGDQPATGADEFYPPAGNEKNAWQAAESPNYCRVPDGTIKNLYVRVQVAPGAGKSSDFTLRVNGADSAVTVQLSDAEQTGNSGALEEAVVDGDYMSLESHPTGTPATDDIGWGFVISPVSSGPANVAEVNGVAAANISKVNGVAWASIAKINGVG